MPKKRRKRKRASEDHFPKDQTLEQVFSSTPKKQLEVVRNFYIMGLDAHTTHEQPGTTGEDKTQKIFRFLDEELLRNYDMDANNRQKLAKQKLTKSFVRLITKMEIQLAKIENVLKINYSIWEAKTKQAKELNKIPEEFYVEHAVEKLRLLIITSIAEARDHLATIDYTLTIHEADEKAILDHLEKKVEKLTKPET